MKDILVAISLQALRGMIVLVVLIAAIALFAATLHWCILAVGRGQNIATASDDDDDDATAAAATAVAATNGDETQNTE